MNGSMPYLCAVVLGYGLLLAAVEFWYRRGMVQVETTRKAAHLGGALLTLPFPWLFQNLLEPSLVGVVFMVFLEYTRRKGWLQSIHGVARPSHGALLFPLGLFLGLGFSMYHGDPWIHIVAVLELGLCDSLAALAGSRADATRLGVGRWNKTVEGCTAFFLSSLALTTLTLWASGERTPYAALNTAIALGILFTWAEFMGRRGLDNILLPLAVGMLYPLSTQPQHDGWFHLLAAASGLSGLALLMIAKLRPPRPVGRDGTLAGPTGEPIP